MSQQRYSNSRAAFQDESASKLNLLYFILNVRVLADAMAKLAGALNVNGPYPIKCSGVMINRLTMTKS